MIVSEVVELIDLAGYSLSPREAILRMAGAGYDYQAAARAYLGELEDGSSSSLQSPSGIERAEDPEKVVGEGEGDRRVSDDTEEESESSSEVCTIDVSLW